ncbi:glycosyl hydrolase family 65 protein [Leucobacter tardus]|nr:glycosyl hydrolase family 65 protein [Leucobacter tardus]
MNPGMETQRSFGDDPWKLVVRGIDPALAGEDETLFSLANGYLGLRGNHEEGLPLGSHGTFVNGLHETWRIQHAENAYGFAEHGQTIVNAPDAKTIRIYVDDERLNLETSEIREVTRTLDLRAGTCTRSLVWLTPTGKRVRVDTKRMVSFVHRHMATVEMTVTALDADAELTFSSLVINRQDLARVNTETPGAEVGEAGQTRAMNDPRQSEMLTDRVLNPGPHRHSMSRTIMSYGVNNSGMKVAVGVDHVFAPDPDREPLQLNTGISSGALSEMQDLGEGWHSRVEAGPDRVRHLFQGTAYEGQTVRLTKTIMYHSSATSALTEMVDRCEQSLEQLAIEPAGQRWRAQRAFLDDFWRASGVEVDAEPGVQQSINWNLFQLAQAAARADGRGIPAKGLTGSGYSGHYFWDSEIYVLPFLTYTTPRWARNALRARERMLPRARARAAMLSENGALFPWRTINGEEASAYYAAGTAAYHINADITYALARYVSATGDTGFIAGGASDIAVETARLWSSLGFWSGGAVGEGQFHIHGVTGPDEYTTVVNDNLFTNVMAQFNLRFAVEVVRRGMRDAPADYWELVERLDLGEDEVDNWAMAAEHMCVPYSEESGVHPQDAHFLEREMWNLEATPPEQKPLLLHFHPLVIYRYQVLKQADVVLALLLASDEFTLEQKRADFEYYDALTTGDSSLSAVVQSIIAAEVGYQDLAYRYFEHALRVDLDNLHRNASDGVHVASAGGIWMTVVQGFAGMRDAGRKLSFDPRLPKHWGRLAFSLMWRGSRISVELERDAISFALVEGDTPVTVHVRGRAFDIGESEPTRVELDGQGPDLGEFEGLSAGILPRDGEGEHHVPTVEVPVITTSIPVKAPFTVAEPEL